MDLGGALQKRMSGGAVCRGALLAGLAATALLPTLWWFSLRAQAAIPNRVGGPADAATARHLEAKLRLLSGTETGVPPSFQPIVITEDEANSYLNFHGREWLPFGVGVPAIHITPDQVSGAADVDFAEFSRANSKPGDWGPQVLAAMFKGKQRVTAAGKLRTYNGRGVFKIEKVAVGSTTVPDWLVDFVMQNYLQPRYNFDVSKPFDLPDHVSRIELGAGQATFFRAPNKRP